MAAQAASPHDDQTISWTGPSGHVHRLIVPGVPALPPVVEAKRQAPAPVDDFAPIVE
jgi:hypothetical protein